MNAVGSSGEHSRGGERTLDVAWERRSRGVESKRRESRGTEPITTLAKAHQTAGVCPLSCEITMSPFCDPEPDPGRMLLKTLVETRRRENATDQMTRIGGRAGLSRAKPSRKGRSMLSAMRQPAKQRNLKTLKP